MGQYLNEKTPTTSPTGDDYMPLSRFTTSWATYRAKISDILKTFSTMYNNLVLNGNSIEFPTTTISDVKDEDDMASDSATSLATQQSIKAYIDNIAQQTYVNLIKNSFDLYNQIDTSMNTPPDSKPEWWDFTGSGDSEFASASSESIASAPNDLLFKITSAAASDTFSQTLTNADEPQLISDSGTFSAGVWVYVFSGTWEWHIDVDSANQYDSGTISTGSWQFLKTEGISVGSTDIDFIFTESTGSGVIYFTHPMLNTGSRLMPYKPRGIQKKNIYTNVDLVNVNDADSSRIDVDCSSLFGNLAVGVCVFGYLFLNSSSNSSGTYLCVYPKGYGGLDANDPDVKMVLGTKTVAGTSTHVVLLDDSNTFVVNTGIISVGVPPSASYGVVTHVICNVETSGHYLEWES